MNRFLKQLKIIAEMIKIEHTIFALPFALMGVFLASEGLPSLRVCLWVLLAMVGARSAAMAFNRLADAKIDAKNPRTANRALPMGLLKQKEVILFTLVSAALFFLSAWMLNPLSFKLAFPVLFILLFYSYCKRFTWLCHFVLGLCLGMTPLAGWIAVKGAFAITPILWSVGVFFWTAGFDLIYACQDVQVDRKEGLHSIPARFSIKGALYLSAILHFFTILFFGAAGFIGQLPWPYHGAVLFTLVFLTWEHSIVKHNDLSKVNVAFFTANGCISVAMALGTFVSMLVI